ncbi:MULTISPECIES: abortive phage infection protein [Bacillus cereus group]|uniref:Abortive phage infection protein n=1 Tax=Bacillus cereus TaxID=1396 RepID=A0A2C0EGP4_BACCE|nr:abortive phage infection protein [Bacillus cereus]PDY81302.1 abortive phage infection protein [Bacillus cereus]PFA15047.1 abortive phage infection protein [Bacillus cereus]PFM42773.1 abortive phage infection protein [Bacillus cereus]PGL60226.1 abortive phage infection protein [Bacillus cereus]PGQ05575.1 abortive phage infection protein [Bacillus cereus]
MDKQLANAILDQLKNGEIKEYVATKDVFYTFREVVVSREDFRHIIGNAQRGGQVIYTYSETPRS